MKIATAARPLQRTESVQRRSRRGRRIGRALLGVESLETRRMLFNVGAPWGVSNLSYSYSNFTDFAPGWAVGLSRVDMQNAVEEAMGVWTAVTPLRIFQRVDSGPMPTDVGSNDTDYPVQTHPTFRWGHHFIDGSPATPNVLGHGNFPGTTGIAGDVHYDDGNTFTIDGMLELGAHEFGHAIGMQHANGNVVGTVLPPAFPAIMHAVIGGRGTWDYNGLETGYLLADDIAGVTSLYGAGLGYVIDIFGELNVYGGAGDDLLSVDYFNGNVIVTSTVINSGVTRSFSRPINDGQTTINSIQLHGMGGSDILRVVNSSGLRVNAYGGAGDDVFDVGFASNNLGNVGETQFFAGDGNDSVFAYDGNNTAGATYSVTSTRFDRPGWGGTRFFDDAENRTLTTGNTANTVNVFNTSAGRQTTIANGGGAEVVNIGTNNSLQQIQGSVVIQNDPSFTTLNLINSADTVARTLAISQQAGNIGQLTGLAPGAIQWDNADIQAINITTGTGGDAVNVFGSSEAMLISNAGGRDTYNVGSSLDGLQGITGALTLRAFFGTDSPLILNDANSNVARNVTMSVNTVNLIDYTIGGLAPANITYRDFGEVTIFEGLAGDTFNFNARIGHRVNVLGGGGNDIFSWGAINNYSEGLGGTFVSAVFLDGGIGVNTLAVNDTSRTAATTYQLFEDRFLSRDPVGFASGADFNYDNMGTINIDANNLLNQLAVFSVSSDIVTQVTFRLNGGNDVVDLNPHDLAGNLTLNGGLGISGGTGTDLFRVQDGSASSPIDYAFSNPTGSFTQNLAGLGTAWFGSSEIENWEIYAGSGNDTFAMNQWTSGRSLGIYGGEGDDELNFGNDNVAALITSISAFGFDGQGGFDTWNMLNGSGTGNWTYTRSASLIAASRVSPTYTLNLSEARVERVAIRSGSGADLMRVNAVSAGAQLDFQGGAGYDQLLLGNASNSVEGIQGPVSFDGQTDGGFVVVNDQADATGDTFHLDQTSLGARAGNNLFGPGGSLQFAGVTNLVSTAGMNINLGSGSDVAFAQPLLNATTVINFNGQNSAAGLESVGDAINLALAGVDDYVISGTTSGNVTSATHAPLLWTGAESEPVIDDVAPSALAADFVYDEVFQRIDVTLSEDVWPTLDLSRLTVTNLETGVDVPSGDIALEISAGSNTATLSFSTFANGALPDANYRVTVVPGYSDPFGNVATTELQADFFALAGDANHDRVVDFSDLLLLAANYNQSPRTFSQADFNYDGSVDFSDLLILASRYNQSLPTSPPAQAAPVRRAPRDEDDVLA